MSGNLTPKQAAFVREYLVDLNATGAAKRAGYSERTAYRTGADNLKKPQIAAAINAALEERAEKVQITAEEVVENLLLIAKGQSEYQAVNGLGDDVVMQPTYRDRLKAWELVGKHLGMFTDKVDVTSGGEKLDTVVRVYLPDNGRQAK